MSQRNVEYPSRLPGPVPPAGLPSGPSLGTIRMVGGPDHNPITHGRETSKGGGRSLIFLSRAARCAMLRGEVEFR
jgi:hypothetical protein